MMSYRNERQTPIPIPAATGSEDPWDGCRFRLSRAKTVAAVRPTVPWLWFVAGLITLLLLAQSSNAGESKRSAIAVGWSQPGDLDADAKYLTEDYLELLDQLRRVTQEYEEYFSDLDIKQAGEYARMLSEFYQVINDSNEYRDHNNLYKELQLLRQRLEGEQKVTASPDTYESDYTERIADLKEFQASLKEQLIDIRAEIDEIERRGRTEDEDRRVIEDRVEDLEREAEDLRRDITKASAKIKLLHNQQGSVAPSPHLSRLIHSLQRELAVISGLLEDEVITPLDENIEYREAIDQYVKLALEAARQASSADLQKYVIFNKEDLGRWKVELKGLEELGEVYALIADSLAQITIPEAPAVPAWTIPSDVDEPEAVVVQPVPPVPPVPPPQTSYVFESDRRAVRRRLVDSIDVPSEGIPIYVVMPSANLKVVGWSENRVVAECEYIVRGDTKAKSEKIASNLDLRMFEKGPAVYIESVMPTIGDASDLQLAGTVTIMTPYTNPVVLKNSFGTVSVADLRNSVRLSSRNSTVRLQDLSGSIEVSSSMGSVYLTDISGRLDVSNAYGTLTMTDCKADMKISNSYATMSMNGCGGKVYLQTSGTTNIADFTGGIEVTGTACPVTISDVKGNVDARTAFQPLDVRDVVGDVSLANSHSSIRVVDIDGLLAACTSHGDISVDGANGPVTLEGDHGTISLNIPRGFSGNSTIKMNRGRVQLLPNPAANLYIFASTGGGQLITKLDAEKSGKGTEVSYKVKLGNGSNKLNITGERVEVVIGDN